VTRRVHVNGVEAVEYGYRVDRLPCCGCIVHAGADESDCDCRCHEAARLAAVLP
jgi:hypothetical protein